jgi:hypothetical protein
MNFENDHAKGMPYKQPCRRSTSETPVLEYRVAVRLKCHINDKINDLFVVSYAVEEYQEKK